MSTPRPLSTPRLLITAAEYWQRVVCPHRRMASASTIRWYWTTSGAVIVLSGGGERVDLRKRGERVDRRQRGERVDRR